MNSYSISRSVISFSNKTYIINGFLAWIFVLYVVRCRSRSSIISSRVRRRSCCICRSSSCGSCCGRGVRRCCGSISCCRCCVICCVFWIVRFVWSSWRLILDSWLIRETWFDRYFRIWRDVTRWFPLCLNWRGQFQWVVWNYWGCFIYWGWLHGRWLSKTI